MQLQERTGVGRHGSTTVQAAGLVGRSCFYWIRASAANDGLARPVLGTAGLTDAACPFSTDAACSAAGHVPTAARVKCCATAAELAERCLYVRVQPCCWNARRDGAASLQSCEQSHPSVLADERPAGVRSASCVAADDGAADGDGSA